MTYKPTKEPVWASTGDKTDYGDTKAESGWVVSAGIPEKPSYKYFNWWQNLVYKWARYFNFVVNTDNPNLALTISDSLNDTLIASIIEAKAAYNSNAVSLATWKYKSGTAAINTTVAEQLSGSQCLQYTFANTTGDFIETPAVQVKAGQVSGFINCLFKMYNNFAATTDYVVQIIRYNSSGTYQETIALPLIDGINFINSINNFKSYFTAGATTTDYYSIQIYCAGNVNGKIVRWDNWFLGRSKSVLSSDIIENYKPKNFLINGGFDIWQRATTGSASIAAGTYVAADRWKCFALSAPSTYTGADFTQYATTPSGNSKYATKITSTSTAVDAITYNQYIEGSNCLPLIGKLCTFSFKVKRLSNNLNARPLVVNINYLNVADGGASNLFTNAGTTSIISSTLIANASQLDNSQYVTYSVTFTCPANAANGLLIQILLGDGVNDIATATGDLIAIGEAMLNLGSFAAPFVRSGENITHELLSCQRYYYKMPWLSETLTVGVGHVQGGSPPNVEIRLTIFIPVSFRTIPSIVGSPTITLPGPYTMSTISIFPVASMKIKSNSNNR